MCVKLPVLIVITDELGSTPRDEKLRQQRDENKITQPDYKNKLLESRKNLFVKQIEGLTQPKNDWTVVKLVGDSIIVRFTSPEGKFEEDLTKCLYTLAKIWASFERNIRVACHLTYFEDILIDGDIKSLKETIDELKKKVNAILDPISESIQWDMFGAAMNKTARLVSIPKEGLFVVSQEVMEKIFPREYLIEEIIPKRVSAELKLSSNKVIGWAYPVPVVNVKGFAEEYTKPWYVWEIIPYREKKEGMGEKGSNNEYRTLRSQFKEFQSLRIVVARYKTPIEPDKMHPWEKKACKTFESRLKTNPCPLFIDFVFSIKNLHKLFGPTMDRDFDCQVKKIKRAKKRIWPDVLTEIRRKGDLMPYYVMFTSVPDIETNKKLRHFFAPKDESKDESWAFQHISFDIYESLQVEYKGKESFKRYFLLLFQIQKRHVNKADDWKRFFKEKDSLLISEHEVDPAHIYTTVAYGLIRGEIDGFVLFGSDGEKNPMGKLEKYISLAITQEKFFDKTAPIFLYDLELMPPFPFPENIKDLTTIRSVHDKERYGRPSD